MRLFGGLRTLYFLRAESLTSFNHPTYIALGTFYFRTPKSLPTTVTDNRTITSRFHDITTFGPLLKQYAVMNLYFKKTTYMNKF